MIRLRPRRPRGRLLSDQARATLGHIALALVSLMAIGAMLDAARTLNLIP